MSKKIQIAVIQLDIVDGDINENLLNGERFISTIAPESDLIVLPEMFTTGFITESNKAISLAETDSGKTVDTLRSWAKHYTTAIAGSIIVNEGGRPVNRFYFIDDKGEIAARYDKHHLFEMSPEATTFNAGQTLPPVVNYRGFNIALTVCYDLRFPVWMRNVAGRYDVMIVTASWPDSRAYAWEHLLIARAIENQAYIVGCNRSGEDLWGTYSGTSAIYSPKGEPLHNSKSDKSVVTATLDLDELTSFREKFPAYLHGDKFTIEL